MNAQQPARLAATLVVPVPDPAALRTAWDKRRQLPLTVICGDGNIGVKGSGFELLFSIPEQGPVSLRKDGKEWLWRAPTPAFWRASTDNDRGCGFPQHASAWMAAAYTLFGAMLYDSLAAGLASAPGLIAEGVLNSAIAIVAAGILQKTPLGRR